jgi:tRNA nucleotidyltransferase (CCA-adding enzyme)
LVEQHKQEFSKRKLDMAERVLHRVLADVKPTPNEIKLLNAKSNELMGRLKEVAPKGVDILLVGSVARGTQIRGTSDIDIFLLFPKGMEERKMEEAGVRIAKQMIKKGGERYEIKYAEHPYVRMFLKGAAATADIVPAFRISNAEEMGSAVDRTQLHNQFVNTRLSQKQRNDVRLLKAFLDARNIYGAEAKIEGFSGYLCELLVYYYGSFVKVIEDLSSLRLPTVIDVLNKGSGGRRQNEMTERFNSDFVVIDPTDRNRNVAANVSQRSLAKAALAARSFIDNPSVNTFYTKGYKGEWASRMLKRLNSSLGVDTIVVSFVLPEMTEDILWQQLKRLKERMSHELQHNGFEQMLSLQGVSGTDAIIAFLLPNSEKRVSAVHGPSALMGRAAMEFMKSHSKSGVLLLDQDKILSMEKPRYSTPIEVLRSIISQNNIKFPSYISKRGTKLYVNRMPERYSRMLHEALEDNVIQQ